MPSMRKPATKVIVFQCPCGAYRSVARRADCPAITFSSYLRHAAARFSGVSPPRLGQDHPCEAPPVAHPAPVDVILQVVAMAGSKIGCALPGQAIELGVVLRRQVVVSKVVQGVAPYRPAYRVELAFKHLVVSATVVELMESAGVLADAG
jgi:hypothetical protein